MPTPKSIVVIECRTCGGSYFGGDKRVTLEPGNETTLPDEIEFTIIKKSACFGCKQRDNRTRGASKKRLDRGYL